MIDYLSSMVRALPILSWILFTLFATALPAEAARGSSADNRGGTWLVHINPEHDARAVVTAAGGTYLEPLTGVPGVHRVRFGEMLRSSRSDTDTASRIRRQLGSQPLITTFEPEALLTRVPKRFVPADPRFPDQWHLENLGQTGGVVAADARVRPAWDAGFSGEGVVIAIVDEGIQYRHPDLEANWLSGSGYDYNDRDFDPSPAGEDDRHGTAVAGISLAASNSIGGLGVAFNAQLVPLRLIAGSFRAGDEAEALSYRKQEVDIYNNSWGPSDDFGVRYVDISATLKAAFSMNATDGRGGLGNIYVWAAGNGGLNGDNSNFDGYNASPYTISVGAVGHDDIRATYSEPGANLLVVAPSRGTGAGILTTDNTGSSGYSTGDLYENFSGTSAATPVVSGVVALLLEKRPDLGWRDVQQILALSATPVDFASGSWNRNGAGHWVSHEYGFGRVDAAAALSLAEGWPILGEMRKATASWSAGFAPGPLIPEGETLSRSISLGEDLLIQHVQVSLSLSHSDWGDLRIELISPEGTRSTLSEPHANANSSGDPGTWTYLSTHHLNERANGTWTLEISDLGTGGSGRLSRFTVEVWGTDRPASPNAPPQADDLFLESVTYPIEIDLMEGVSDADGDQVELISLQPPRSGSITRRENGAYAFTMGETKNGTEHFSVLYTDGKGAVLRRMVEVLDPRPVGRNDLFPVLANQSTVLPVLRNDLDPDGDPLRLTGISGSFSGTADLVSEGAVRFTPPDGFTGVARIRYELTDDSDGDSHGWVTAIVQKEADVALNFDGVDDYLLLPGTTSLEMEDAFTAEAWIYPEDWGEYVTGFGRIFDRDTFVFFLNGFDHSFYNDQSLVAYFVLENGEGVAANSVGGSVRLNEWQHVAVSYDSSDRLNPIRLYVNGEAVAFELPLSDSAPSFSRLGENSLTPLYMGESDSGARAFKGSMTEFRVWQGALSPSLVRARHDRRLGGTESGLSLYLPLNRTLAPEAFPEGSVSVTATIYEAQRVPLELPWADLEGHFSFLQDAGNGWWQERTLGWLYGDRYPWVYLSSLGWAYAGWEGRGNRYLFYRPGDNWGLIRTEASLYPWFYHYGTGDWFLYLEGSADPAWFFATGAGTWFNGIQSFPLP